MKPIPIAWPFMAAMTGFLTSQAGISTPEALKPSEFWLAKVSSPAVMSAPAQKAVPAPVRITTRTASSSSQRR